MGTTVKYGVEDGGGRFCNLRDSKTGGFEKFASEEDDKYDKYDK